MVTFPIFWLGVSISTITILTMGGPDEFSSRIKKFLSIFFKK